MSGEVGRIRRVNNSKVELRWVGGGGGCNDDFRDRSSTVSIKIPCPRAYEGFWLIKNPSPLSLHNILL